MAKVQNPEEGGAQDLSFDGVKGMKSKDATGKFKKSKATWLKPSVAGAILILLNFDKNSDKKPISLAIPYKNEQKVKEAFKAIKADKKTNFPLKKVAAGTFALSTDKQSAVITLTNGKATMASLEKFGTKVFTKLMKIRVTFVKGANFEEEPAEPGDDEPLEVEEADETDMPADDAPAAAENTAPVQPQPQGPDPLFNQVKNMVTTVAADIKNKITTDIMNKLRSRQVTADDGHTAANLGNTIEELKRLYESASATVKQAFAAGFNNIVNFIPTLDRVKEAIQNALNAPAASANPPAAENSRLQDLLRNVDVYLQQVNRETQQNTQTLQNTPPAPLPGGRDLLNQL